MASILHKALAQHYSRRLEVLGGQAECSLFGLISTLTPKFELKAKIYEPTQHPKEINKCSGCMEQCSEQKRGGYLLRSLISGRVADHHQ
jgi:xanthine dehydrogenase molybdopterin-binding subunit B